jgi:maleylacetoacetate isomerase/maleylpyruvate isomerase
LYGYYRSSTSYRLRIALNLKGLEYENIPVNLLHAEQKAADFAARNPFASVPMLAAGGRDRAQSMAILEWLDEAYPAPAFLPRDIEARYTVRELAYGIATEIHAVNNLPVLKYLKDPLGHAQDEIDTWYRHWLARTLNPVEARLARQVPQCQRDGQAQHRQAAAQRPPRPDVAEVVPGQIQGRCAAIDEGATCHH